MPPPIREQQNNQQPPEGDGMQRLFLIALAIVVVLATGFCVIIVSSLIPYYGVIGQMAIIVVGVLLGCIALLMISYTWYRMGSWGNRRKLLIAGEVVVLMRGDGTFVHLSAEHERAKLPQQVVQALPSPSQQGEEDNDLPMSDEHIAELYQKGQSQEAIASLLKTSRHQIRTALIREGLIEESGKKRRG